MPQVWSSAGMAPHVPLAKHWEHCPQPGSAALGGLLTEHVPSDPHILQAGHTELAQQNPSTQLPVVHSLAAEQPCPFFFLHAPAALQVFRPVQVSGSSALMTATQVPPAPVQAWQDTQVWVQQCPSTQLPLAQSLVARQSSPLLFLHAPAAPHVFAPVQVVPVVSSALDTVRLQVPAAPQFRQVGQVDCVQHTPSRQVNPV